MTAAERRVRTSRRDRRTITGPLKDQESLLVGGWVSVVAHAVLSASVGERRAARIAGRMPAIAPIRIAAAMPPPQASVGITVVQCLVWA